MNPSRIFILRPVATSLLTAGLLLVGLVAYRQLPVSALPQVDYPTIQILTFYPGASPEVMASSVTTPLERQFGQLPGLNQMTSTSSFGSSIVVLQFNLNESIDVAEQEVQAAINASSTYLPRDLPNPPIYTKTNPADAPVLTLALTSDTLPLSKVEDLADTTLAQKISQIPGVGLVSISGGQKPAVRVQANPTALASYGLGLEDLRTVLTQANVDQAKGSIEGPRLAYTIGADDQLMSSDGYKPVIIAYRNGSPVRVMDVATVVDSAENVKQAAWENTHPAVIMNIQRQPGANIIAVVDRIQKLLPTLRSALPKAVTVSVLADRTETIRASVSDVKFELMLTVALVVMVMFLFLRTVSATVIPSITVPLSLVGTFGVMYLLGYSLDNLSLMALTISTGFVVDDAIVMIENISRYIEVGDSPVHGGAEGLGADRVHHCVADRLAHRGADPVVVHGRRGGAAVPRIRGHPGGHDSGVGGDFADPDADDVRQAAAPPDRTGAGLVLPQVGAVLSRGDRKVRHHAAFCPASPADHAAADRRHAGADLLPLHRRAQGLFPGAGHGRDSGNFRGHADGLVPGHGRSSAETRGGHSQGPGCRESVLLHRRGRDQHHHQQRPYPDQPQAARAAQRHRVGDHPAAAAPGGADPGHHPLHAAGAGPDGGRPGQPHPVPVHHRRCQRGGAGPVDAAAGGQAAHPAGTARRRQRPAERRFAGGHFH